MTKLLEKKSLNMASFAVPRRRATPKIQLDPWGNAYKAPDVPKSKTSKVRPAASPKKKAAINKETAGQKASKQMTGS